MVDLARSTSMQPETIEVTVTQANQLVTAGQCLLVDVREQKEWDAGRAQLAIHVQLAELGQAAEVLDSELPILFICLSGGRSLMAAEAFRRAGIPAYSVAGGMLDWQAQNLPMTPENATVVGH